MICTALKDFDLDAEGDLIEVRLDLIQSFTIEKVQQYLKDEPRPVILTLRSASQGGAFKGTEEERLSLLKKLAALQPEYIDIEEDVPQGFFDNLKKQHPSLKVIVSSHDFKGNEAFTIGEKLKKLEEMPGDLFKIAVKCSDIIDTLKMMVWLKKQARKDIIAIPMGEAASVGRILSLFCGSPFTYAKEEDNETAPGQLNYSELKKYLGFKNPHLYGLIGDPVSLSIGHIVHNTIMQKGDLASVYVKMKVQKDHLSEFFAIIKELEFKGLSVTTPLKEAVIPHLESLDHEAENIGAVNTINFVDTSIGYNTDGIGALNALERHINISGQRILILGAGGAAKAIAFEAKKRGAEVSIANRTESKGKILAESLGVNFLPLPSATKFLVVINCVSDPLFTYSQTVGDFAMDIKTVPKLTPFLTEAKKQGSQLIFGYEMFIEQAKQQAKIWFPDFNNEKFFEQEQKNLEMGTFLNK